MSPTVGSPSEQETVECPNITQRGFDRTRDLRDHFSGSPVVVRSIPTAASKPWAIGRMARGLLHGSAETATKRARGVAPRRTGGAETMAKSGFRFLRRRGGTAGALVLSTILAG